MKKNNQNEGMNKKHRSASKVIFICGVIGAFVAFIAFLTTVVLLFFPVREIEVSGDSRYSYSEIISASGIKNGSRLYFINESKAERKILSQKPYLESVSVNSYFPNRVKIEIKEFEDIYMTEHTSGFCYVNGDFEILEIVDKADSFAEFSSIFIRLEQPLSGEVGTVYEGEDTQRVRELADVLKEYGFYQYLNIIDVRGKYDVSFVINKKQVFELGSMVDLDEKIDASFKVCFTDGFKRDQNCIINSSDKKKIVLRYVNDEIILNEFDFCEKK